MAYCAAATVSASLARRTAAIAGKFLCRLLDGVWCWRWAECAAAAGVPAPRTLKRV